MTYAQEIAARRMMATLAAQTHVDASGQTFALKELQKVAGEPVGEGDVVVVTTDPGHDHVRGVQVLRAHRRPPHDGASLEQFVPMAAVPFTARPRARRRRESGGRASRSSSGSSDGSEAKVSPDRAPG